MIIEEISLLSENDYIKYRHLIPLVNAWYWLKTPEPLYKNAVRIIDERGDLAGLYCSTNGGDVRPVCFFDFEPGDLLFWYKGEKLIGSKIKYGAYSWTVLNIENNKLYALCDEIIATCRRFDDKSNVFERSELKYWLKTTGLQLITT